MYLGLLVLVYYLGLVENSKMAGAMVGESRDDSKGKKLGDAVGPTFSPTIAVAVD